MGRISRSIQLGMILVFCGAGIAAAQNYPSGIPRTMACRMNQQRGLAKTPCMTDFDIEVVKCRYFPGIPPQHVQAFQRYMQELSKKVDSQELAEQEGYAQHDANVSKTSVQACDMIRAQPASYEQCMKIAGGQRMNECAQTYQQLSKSR